MDEVMNQAPEHISKEDAEIIFKKNKECVTDTLIELWELDVPKSAASQPSQSVEDILANDKTVLPSDKAKWASIRDICDSYDIEMQTQMNRMKNRS
jgi:hypothetical protein